MDTLKDYWEQKHAVGDLEALSGNTGLSTLRNLRLLDIVKQSSNILDIGVGMGFCARDLVSAGHRVSCIDISESALLKIKHIAEKIYLASDVNLLPSSYFDYALSMCVVQHMALVDLKYQFLNVLRSLKPSGVFAFNYVFPIYDNVFTETDIAQRTGGVAYPIEFIYSAVADCGGVITDSFIADILPELKVGGAIIHAKKR